MSAFLYWFLGIFLAGAVGLVAGMAIQARIQELEA